MSQILTATAPLWKPSNRNNNIEFLSSFKRLQKEDPQTYAIVEQKEGYICQDHEYEYKVGMSKYGLWCSRRKMGMEGLKQLEDKPAPRPIMTTSVSVKEQQPDLTKIGRASCR